MPKKDSTQTINVDPATQRFQNEQLRPGAIQAADALRNLPQFGPDSFRAFMDPFQREVIDGVRGDFDRQREFASTAGAQAATSAGAFGGSRQAVLQSRLLDDVNRNEVNALASLDLAAEAPLPIRGADDPEVMFEFGFDFLGRFGQGDP